MPWRWSRPFLGLDCPYRFLVTAPKGRILGMAPNLVQDTFPLAGHAWEQMRLLWLVRRFKANLLWCPCNTAPMMRSNVPLIVNIYDAACFSGPEWFSKSFRIFYQRLTPRIGKICNNIITCSNFSKQELIKYDISGAGKIKVIYGGINHLDSGINGSDAIKDLLSKIQGKSYILVLGSRDPRKNVNRLLSAWDRLPQRIKEGKALVVTGGSSAVFAEERTPEKNEDIIFLGYVPDKQLPALYKYAEAFVFPSLYEGFGFPPLEAMSCGIPTLVAAAGSLPEVCGDAALFCDPSSTADISEKLEKLLTDQRLRNELRERGFELVKKFTWTKAALEMDQVFKEVLKLGG